jgi:galactose mutarotase-like enzyme
MSQKTKNKNQTKTSKKRTQCVLDTIIRKHAQIMLIRHEPSYKQLEVKTNQPSFVCGNHNTDDDTLLSVVYTCFVYLS